MVKAMTLAFRKKIMKSDDGNGNCKSLQNSKVEQKWVTEFLDRHNDELSHKVPRPGDKTRTAAFNSFVVEQFFAQVKILFVELNIG